MDKKSKTGSNKAGADSQSRLSSLTGSNSATNASSEDSGNRLVIVKATEEPEFSGTPAMEADEALAAQQEFMNDLRSAVETSRNVYESNVSTLSSAVNTLDDSVLMCAVADWMTDHISNLNGDEAYESCLSEIDSWISIYGEGN